MAREDLITKYIAAINSKQDIQPTDDNQPLQFITAPTDTVSAGAAAQAEVLDPSTFVLGGNQYCLGLMGVVPTAYLQPGWKWGQGQWK